MEELHLDKEEDAASRDRLDKLRVELADKQEALRALETRWEREKQSLNAVGEIKERIDEVRNAAERAQRDGDMAGASELVYGEIPALEKQLAEAQAAEASRDEDSMVHEEVGADDIDEVVASWTGIPTGRLLEGETGKLLRMEEELGRRLIGQKKAVAAVSDAVRRSRAGISDPDRP